MELIATWEDDCSGKQDFDANLVRLSSRYYPPRSALRADGALTSPSALAAIYLQDREIATASFEGVSEVEVKAAVEAWAAEQFAKVVNAMVAEFQR